MIQINGCGHNYRQKPNFQISRPGLFDEYLLIIMKTEAVIYIEGIPFYTEPNTAVLFNKNSYQHYGSYGNAYMDDWIHFTMDKEEEAFLHNLEIPFGRGIRLADVSQISELIYSMTQDKYSDGTNTNQILDYFMHILLLKLEEQANILPDAIQYHKHFYTLNKLRAELHNTPYKDWTVEKMALEVNMSPSYFQHLYKELFRVSCMNDLIRIRIEYAKLNLIKTDLSINEVADLCGYENEVHFMRQFKKITGSTPSQYRKRHPDI